MSSQRNDTQRLIKKYQADIASLEEKEDYLTRRIQVMENLIPTIMVWYMWRVAQARKPGTFSESHSEEDARKQLLHLENILEELQEADCVLKEEEKVMRSRIEELESSIRKGDDEPFPLQNVRNESEATKERKRIKALEENKIQFKDLLEDPNTNWPNKCKELCEKVNTLSEVLGETNDALKSKDDYIKQLQEGSSGRGKLVEEKIKDLEKQNNVILSEVVNHEKERDAEEASLNKKVNSAVQEAIEEVKTLKNSLKNRESTGEEKNIKGKKNKNTYFPRQYSITEEEEEETKSDVLDREVPHSRSHPEFFQKPLVLTPDEVLPGSQTSAPKQGASVPPLPQIFESMETVKELSPRADSEIKLRTTATGTVISVPPDLAAVPSVSPDDLSPVKRPSILKDKRVSQDFQSRPVPSSTAAGQPELPVPTSTVPDKHQSANAISGIEPKGLDSRALKEPSVSEVATKVPPTRQPSVESRLRAEPVVSPQSSKPARSSKVSEVLPQVSGTGAPLPEKSTTFAKSDSQSEKPKLTSVAASEQIPSTSKATADMSEGRAIISEPYEVPYTDGIEPTPSGLAVQQQAGTLKPGPSESSLTGQTLQSKCRVKDHMIKTMADDLKDLSRRNMWSGNKMFKDTSADPVKTYDFDRTTLFKYIKGQEPKDLAPSLKSNDPYSAANPLQVKLGRKLDKDSLLVEWGPSPSQEIVGFQIFINGEFKYWVHSAKRSKALLHPVNLATRMEITVSPINAAGDIVHRSSITYMP